MYHPTIYVVLYEHLFIYNSKKNRSFSDSKSADWHCCVLYISTFKKTTRLYFLLLLKYYSSPLAINFRKFFLLQNCYLLQNTLCISLYVYKYNESCKEYTKIFQLGWAKISILEIVKFNRRLGKRSVN